MKTKDKSKQYVIYSRKSKFTGKGESIENQIELCRQYIAMHFGDDAAENALVYEDEGFSGGNLERPQFKKMMKDSQKIEFAAIVVYRLDRISRNIGDFAKLIEDLGDRHIDFISIREQFDTSSPMGRAMMYIASVFSQLERETIAERIRDNMHELSKTGRWLGGTTPTGYASESESKITVDGKERKAYKLKPIPEEIQLVKMIFSVFMETGSLSKTDQYLLEHRCVTKRGKQFTRFAIRGILTNPVYMIADETAYQYLKENNVDLFAERSEFDGEHGVMAYNRTLQRPGKANQIRPMEEWIVAVGKHPGIVAGSDWVRVQAMLDVNKSKNYRRPRSNVALLSGLLRCGECGDYMRPKLTNRRAAGGELIYTYMCSTKERSHGTVCAMKTATATRWTPRSSRRSVSCPPTRRPLPGCWRRPRRSSAAARRATTQSWRCSGKNTPKRRTASSGWWSPCPLPARPPRSTSWSRLTHSIRRARHSSCALPSWKRSPSRAGCSIRSSPSIRK